MQRPLVAVVVMLSVAGAARAQGVTEEEFLSTLDEGHDAVRALMEGMADAEGASAEARALSNPRLEFWREAPDASPQLTNWTLAWTPPLDGRRGPGKKAAEEGLAAARGRLDTDRAALRQEFRKVFADWSTAFERLEILKAQFDLVSRLAGHERERARAGEGSGLAARRFTLTEGEIRAAAGEAEAALARADAAARALRKGLADAATPAPTVLPEPPAALEAAGAPQLGALAHEKAQADHEARRAGRYFGFPTLTLGWQTLEDSGDDDSGPILAAGWSLPIFHRDQGARVRAERMQDVAAARLAFAEARLAGALDGGLGAYRALHLSAGAARDTADESQAVIDGATAAFRAGEMGLTDLFDALRSAFDALLRAVDARARALEAHRDLEAIYGRPLATGGPR